MMIKYKLGDCIREIVDKTTENNQFEVLSVTKDGIFSQEDFFKKQIASEDNTGYKIIRKDNLVFSTMNLWMGSLDVLSNYDIGIVSPAYKIFEFDSNKMLPSFGKYFMKSHFMLEQYKNCSEQGASIVRRNLDLKLLLDTEIIIPTIDEQRKIVLLLENIDEIIKKYNSLIENKEQFIKSQFVRMFGECNNKIKLEKIAKVYDGTHQTPKYTSSGIKFISVENIDDIYNSNKYISQEAFDEYKIKPKINDLFMTRIGTIGKCAIFSQKEDIAYYVSLALIRPNENIINTVYLKNYIESSIGEKEIRSKTLTYATPIKINKEDIGKINILVPAKNEQRKFIRIVELIDKQKFELEKQKQNYMDLKKGLMQQLLTGKVKIS